MEEKGYRSYATFSMEFFRKLKEKKWKNVGVLIKSIEDEINKEKGNNPIQSSSESIFAYTIKPGIPKAKLKYPDYLPDDIVGFIKKIDINDLEKIRDLRNCVSHSWNPENDIITNLHKWYPNSKTKKVELDMKVRKLCINTINSLIGLNLKS
jgi:hypothetical protein